MSYDDYRNTSTLNWTSGGIEVSRTIYIRAADEVEVIADADCPQRGAALDIGPGSATYYIYCDSVSVSAIAEAGGDSSGNFLYQVTANYKPLSAGNPQVNKARWSIAFRAQQYNLRNVKEEADQTRYGPEIVGVGEYPIITTAINADSEGVKGVDLDEMVEVLTIEFWKDPDDVEDFLDDVRAIVNTINDDDFTGPWGTYATGEARITGLSVGVTQGELASVFVEVSRSVNVEDAEMTLDSSATPVTYDKAGWQYAWVRYIKGNLEGDVDIRPLSIDLFVADVYESGDYDALGISGGIWV